MTSFLHLGTSGVGVVRVCGLIPPVYAIGRPPGSLLHFQGFFAECRPANGRPPVRNLVDPYVFFVHT